MPAPMMDGAFVGTAWPLELELEALGAALLLACETEAEADEAAPDMDEETAADSDCRDVSESVLMDYVDRAMQGGLGKRGLQMRRRLPSSSCQRPMQTSHLQMIHFRWTLQSFQHCLLWSPLILPQRIRWQLMLWCGQHCLSWLPLSPRQQMILR